MALEQGKAKASNHQVTACLTRAEQTAPVLRLDAPPPKFVKAAEGELGSRGDPLANRSRVVEAFASADQDLVQHLLGQVTDTVPYGNYREIGNINFAVAELHSIGPRDGLETLLAVQMVGVHNIAMEFLKRAALKDQTSEGLDMNVSRATRFLRVFFLQVDALKKYRSNGEQRVQVEHVHVHRGGQAIVGAVNHRSREGKEHSRG